MLLEAYQAFSPESYLTDYYSEIGPENLELLRFFTQAYQDVSEQDVLLEFSGGPTLYSLITAAKKAREIHFSDFLPQNLAEVQRWKAGVHPCKQWSKFLEAALALEKEEVDLEKIQNREALLRTKLTTFLPCDGFDAAPLGWQYKGYYNVVAANFVAESITSSKSAWQEVMGNICSLLRENGTLILTAIQGAQYYCINNKRFPAVSITETDMFQLLVRLGFDPSSILMYSIPAEVSNPTSPQYKGYDGMIFVRAKR